MIVDARSRPAVRGRDIPKSPSLMVPCGNQAGKRWHKSVSAGFGVAWGAARDAGSRTAEAMSKSPSSMVPCENKAQEGVAWERVSRLLKCVGRCKDAKPRMVNRVRDTLQGSNI